MQFQLRTYTPLCGAKWAGIGAAERFGMWHQRGESVRRCRLSKAKVENHTPMAEVGAQP